jgi:hypothetical protein
MTTIGFESDWTIHRDGCKDAEDLEIMGTFTTLDEFVNHLIETGNTYAKEIERDLAEGENLVNELRADIKANCLKPCTGLR